MGSGGERSSIVFQFSDLDADLPTVKNPCGGGGGRPPPYHPVWISFDWDILLCLPNVVWVYFFVFMWHFAFCVPSPSDVFVSIGFKYRRVSISFLFFTRTTRLSDRLGLPIFVSEILLWEVKYFDNNRDHNGPVPCPRSQVHGKPICGCFYGGIYRCLVYFYLFIFLQ